MVNIDTIAKGLNIGKEGLIRESLKTYLNQRLIKIETDLYLLVKKYGVKNIFEFDTFIKKGFIKEKDAYENYFIFDNLEAEREKIKKILNKL